MDINCYTDNGGYIPSKAHEADAGFDLRTPVSVQVAPHSSARIDTLVHMQIPNGYVGFLKSKSGLNVNHGITSEGVIDSGYTGSIVVKLYNNSDVPMNFIVGDKITQIVILPIPDVHLVHTRDFKTTERGNNGFGSTGR